jgi:hypothetical protein
MSRRSARGQSLPKSEVEFLRTLSKKNLKIRVHQLYQAGWTYKSIGDVLDPPRPRSTIKSWVDSISSSTAADGAVDAPPVNFPRLRTPEGGYQRKTPKSPGVSEADADRLSTLARSARLYRHGMGASHPASIANDEFDALLRSLRDSNVSIADLARASEVTHRAISRRLRRL